MEQYATRDETTELDIQPIQTVTEDVWAEHCVVSHVLLRSLEAS